jgi:DNA-directed RNA polymerase subunit RPC12/RpoP
MDKKKKPKLELIARRHRFLGTWGKCDRCGQYSTRRWQFEKTTRGQFIACAACRERLLYKGEGYEALDSHCSSAWFLWRLASRVIDFINTNLIPVSTGGGGATRVTMERAAVRPQACCIDLLATNA